MDNDQFEKLAVMHDINDAAVMIPKASLCQPLGLIHSGSGLELFQSIFGPKWFSKMGPLMGLDGGPISRPYWAPNWVNHLIILDHYYMCTVCVA